MGSVTIKDIAQLAHVSHTTVSRALNGSPLVNEETRQKIRLLAESMNYVPNLSAKGLVRVRSYNIGVFFTSLVHATSSDFIYTVIQSVTAFPEAITCCSTASTNWPMTIALQQPITMVFFW